MWTNKCMLVDNVTC